MRKSRPGTEREAESPFVMTILAVVAPCRWEGSKALDYMTKWCQALLQGAQRGPLVPHRPIDLCIYALS
jgi:hypothetical protein